MDDSRLAGEWSVVRTNEYFSRHGLWNAMEYEMRDEIAQGRNNKREKDR